MNETEHRLENVTLVKPSCKEANCRFQQFLRQAVQTAGVAGVLKMQGMYVAVRYACSMVVLVNPQKARPLMLDKVALNRLCLYCYTSYRKGQ